MESRVKGTPCLRVDTRRPRAADLRWAAAVLKNGGVITLPTDTVYGLAADPMNPAAVQRLYHLKGRQDNKPVACLLAYRQQALSLSEDLTDEFWRLAKNHWPGDLTLVARRASTVPAWLTRGLPGVGMRWPDCPWVWELCDALGSPLAVTSANRSGHGAEKSSAAVNQQWGARVELLIDGGDCPGGTASSVVDCMGPRPRLLRAGKDASRLGI
jgi:L-threonylcarbamoyladenylate synthase